MNRIIPMEAALYHADYSAWSRSMLSTFRESKREAYLRYIEKSAPESTTNSAMKLGSLAHTMLLEPHEINNRFVAIPKELLAKNGAISTKDAKQFVMDNEEVGREVIKPKEWEETKKVVDSILKVCGKWLEKATQIEHAIYWNDPVTGLALKARPDWIVRTASDVFIFDLKTTTRIIPHTFSRVVETHEYWLQESHYRQGESVVSGTKPHMFFVGIEQSWPYRAGLFQLSQESRDKSFECWRYLVNQVSHAIEKNAWADPWEDEITVMDLKDYVFRSAS